MSSHVLCWYSDKYKLTKIENGKIIVFFFLCVYDSDKFEVIYHNQVHVFNIVSVVYQIDNLLMAEQTQFIKMTLVVFRFVAATQHSGRLLVRPTLRHKNCLQLERNTSAYRHFSLSYSRNIAYQIKDNLRDCYNLLNVDEECTLDELKVNLCVFKSSSFSLE